MRSGIFAVSICLTVLLLGCGDDGEESAPSQEAEQGGIELSGETEGDNRIAADLREYVNRLCSGSARVSRSEYVDSLAGNDPQVEAIRQSFIERYGSLQTAYSTMVDRCKSYEEIAVADGVISVETSLGRDRLGLISAEDTCQVIQASDVADFTVGHHVLGGSGEVLVSCRGRVG